MRIWRDLTDPKATPEQRQRQRARSTARYYIRKGVFRREPCEACGTTTAVENHHDNYDEPLNIRYFCGACHRALHRDLRQPALVAA